HRAGKQGRRGKPCGLQAKNADKRTGRAARERSLALRFFVCHGRPRMPTPAPTSARATRPRFAVRIANTGRRLARFTSRNRTVALLLLFAVIADTGFGTFASVWDRYSPDDYTTR